jgi:prenyltransferase beta subunit
MLQVARVAPKLLGDSTSLVSRFVRSKMTKDGGFGDREGRADVYYTVFGLEALLALQEDLPRAEAAKFLHAINDIERLDFVHACSLARCGACLEKSFFGENVRRRLADRIQSFRCPDGGYHGTPGRKQGSAYGALLAWGALSDLGIDLSPENSSALRDSVVRLQLPNGSFANEPGMAQGTTTATAAAVTICRHLGHRLGSETGTWLLVQQHASGGFLAAPQAPLPDLLSTAVALHALSGLEVSFAAQREACLDFVDSLWSAEGGFHGHWADDELDCEYTYYGLLALGHLAL